MAPRKTNEKEVLSQPGVSDPVSRRDFIRVTTATGIASLAVPSVAAFAQENPVLRGENPTSSGEKLPKSEPLKIYEGPAGGAVVEQLRAAGIRTVFHTNTTGVAPIFDGVLAAGDMQVINVTHEGQAVAAAQGYTMASKSLGFFVGSGVGVGNAMSNLYNAWKDRVPLIVSFTHGGLENQGGMDWAEDWDGHLQPTEPFTTWSWSCLVAETMPDIVRRAIGFAFGPPSGPVTLDFPTELQSQRIKAPIYKIDLAKARSAFRADPDLIQTAARWLAEAENPLFIVGPEISEEGANEAIRELAEKLSVPVVELGWPNELYSNFPTDHPLYLGMYISPMRYPRNIDLVMNFGEKFYKTAQPPQGTPSVHISHDPTILGKVFTPDLAIASEVRTAIRDLSDALDGILTKDRLNRIRSKRLAEVAAFTGKLKQSRELALRGRFDQTPLSWERVGYELEQALDKDAVIVPEVGTQHKKLMGQLTFGKGNKQRIGRTTGSALGWGIGAAFGVNLALPDRQVVSVQGDGGFLFGQSETLWSIARYEAPMLIVIMNNHVYNDSLVRNMRAGGLQFQEGKSLTSYLGSPDVDFAKMAEAYSLKGETVRTPGELAPALQRAIRSMRDGKAVLLDLHVSPEGQLSDSTWHQRYSIAEVRNKKKQIGM
ncbi:MAG: thiamine pyrophosphate-binding protein [Acidobacteria bacterium]|nr:thiamine pyrophosphate-binding protein [Acidobacteriota bacterium]